ncbi:alpha/beta fold hydrolase [Chitinophaga sancti]|uniref:Alpha/beta hydrolase n=1 Tax=Chitinophaga sancti TaxID=1004 RepID=A0A1K1RQ57_9BACT|nr:alpha/beta hydrolase [Chitinophaga sancti]WQD62569.1 alpha/beta hydrolase [Chitinophaga sancti]WQG91862.1 alpha/beta hydrolase [Chitinophaga sancti]SFW73847.1 proline iminopeptidase [Chitinophaga sancti]
MRFLFFLLLVCTGGAKAQIIVSHAFGDSTKPAVIFMHGGPGSNAINFESTTAARLAVQGFYVITYDRRGEGRSVDPTAKYTFQQSYDDLNNIYKQYQIKSATLIGFSFGGIVATGYADKYPEQVDALVLVSALVNLQETYRTIIASCRKIYAAKNDAAGLKDLDNLEKLDRASIEFRRGCFKQASKNGFFATPNRSPDAQAIYQKLDADTLYQYYANLNNDMPSNEFWKHEKYSTINNLPVIEKIVKGGIPVYAMYGKDDGLYSPEQVNSLKAVIGTNHILYMRDAAHYLYNDQQVHFLSGMRAFLYY